MNIDSIQVEKSHELISKVRELIIHYQAVFREKPSGVAVNAYQWLQLKVTFESMQRRDDEYSGTGMQIDGVKISVKMGGPPEILAREYDATFIAYMRQKDDKRLLPLIMGA